MIFDLSCRGEHEEQFIVEMQRANIVSCQGYSASPSLVLFVPGCFKNYSDSAAIFTFLHCQDQKLLRLNRHSILDTTLGSFSDRMVFYNCRAINEQLPAGKQSIDYAIRETYSISVLDFILPGSPGDTYLHEACTYYRGLDELFSAKQRYTLIELPKFGKTIDELTSELDKWIYLLKHLRRMREVPAVFRSGIFPEVLEIAEISNLTMEDHKMYRSSLQDEHDYEMALAYAKQEAAKEGLEQGLEQGLEEGIEQGKQSVAKNLIRNTGFSDEEIAALAGVEESFVRRARSE